MMRRNHTHERVVGWLLYLTVQHGESDVGLFANAVDLYYRFVNVTATLSEHDLQFAASGAFSIAAKVREDCYSSDLEIPCWEAPLLSTLLGELNQPQRDKRSLIRLELKILERLRYNNVARSSPFHEIIMTLFEALSGEQKLGEKDHSKVFIIISLFSRIDLLLDDPLLAALSVVFMSKVVMARQNIQSFVTKLQAHKVAIDCILKGRPDLRGSLQELKEKLPHALRLLHAILKNIISHKHPLDVGTQLRTALRPGYLEFLETRIRAVLEK